LLLVAVAIVAISAGVATGAVVFGARTGLFPTKAEQAMGGPGEALNPAAHDFRAVALEIASDIRYPDRYGSWRDFLISREIRFADDGALESTGALHGWFAASAFCAWVLETYLVAWQKLDAIPSGERARLWLFGVARNLLLKAATRRRSRHALVERLAAELRSAHPPQAPVEDERTAALRAALTALPER
jgi:hypothetical protein